MTSLQNKTVLIVGGSSGIGFAVARAALQSLARTVIIASSNAERVAGAVARLQAHALSAGEVRGEVVDAKDAGALKEFAGRVGAVDHVVWTSGDVPSPEEGMSGACLLGICVGGRRTDCADAEQVFSPCASGALQSSHNV